MRSPGAKAEYEDRVAANRASDAAAHMSNLSDEEESGRSSRWNRKSLEAFLHRSREAPSGRRWSLNSPSSPPRPVKSFPSMNGEYDMHVMGHGSHSHGSHSHVRRTLLKAPVSSCALRTPEPLHIHGRLRKKARMVHVWKDYHFKLQDSTIYCFDVDRAGKEKDKVAFSILDAELWSIDDGRSVFARTRHNLFVEFLPTSRDEGQHWGSILAVAATRHFEDVYTIGGTLGSGNFSDVCLGYDHSQNPVAVKIMHKKKADKELLDSVKREVQFLQLRITHPRLVQTLDVFDTRSSIYIVMECVSGGTLLDALEDRRVFSERDVQEVIRSIVEGLAALHHNHVVHRDLKLENVLLEDRNDLRTAKIADFGLSEIEVEDENGRFRTRGMYGTPLYCCPEIARDESYDVKVDIWSLGIMMYKLISARFPFDGETVNDVLRAIKNAVLVFPDIEWRSVSSECKTLIRSMLDVRPDKRPSCNELLKTPWLRADKEDQSARGLI